MRFVESSLQTLCDAHPGDDEVALGELVRERSSLTGWETWTNLVREQLAAEGQFDSRTNGEFFSFLSPQQRPEG